MPLAIRAAPGATHDAVTLDIPEPQLLISYPDDPHFAEHARVVLLQLGQGDVICLTPTEDVQQDNFRGEVVRSLGRRQQYPERGRPFFGFAEISEQRMTQLRAEARAMALLLQRL